MKPIHGIVFWLVAQAGWCGESGAPAKLIHEPRWAIFYDFHTMPAQPDVGLNFDADDFANRLGKCGVDYTVFHARCNLGMAYYDTKVGIRHPSLKYDLFGRLAEACQRRGIAITAYFNVGLSHEEGLLHRDWLALTPEGYTYLPDRMNHFMRRMCYNTAYADHLIEMIREVVSRYPVSGLFLDCMGPNACVGVECVREMKRQGIDWQNAVQRDAFARASQLRLARRIRAAALAIKPDLLLYFNGVGFEDQQDIGTYLEFECLPTGGWGYELLPVYGRYLRNLGKPVLNMTGRFHRSWGDFGGIRTEASLEYDCISALANGLGSCVGDHWHPRGEPNEAVFDLIGRVYGRLRPLDPWLKGARAECDMAVVATKPRFGNEVLGATRLLAELKQQFDVVTEKTRWGRYRTLILPDTTVLTDGLRDRVERHLKDGGSVIASGWSGLDPGRKEFVLQEWGVSRGPDEEQPVSPTGAKPTSFSTPLPCYFRPGPEIAAGMPDMPLNCYVPGLKVVPREGTRTLARAVAPYFPWHWDGEHHFVYLPPDRETEQSIVTRNGGVVHIARPIFTAYNDYAPVPLRQMVSNILASVHPDPLIRAANLPSFARVTVTGQPGRRMVYVTSYVPERRGAQIDMIEEPVELRDVSIGLRLDGRNVKKAYLAPSRTEVPLAIKDGYATAALPGVKGWAVVVFEE